MAVPQVPQELDLPEVLKLPQAPALARCLDATRANAPCEHGQIPESMVIECTLTTHCGREIAARGLLAGAGLRTPTRLVADRAGAAQSAAAIPCQALPQRLQASLDFS